MILRKLWESKDWTNFINNNCRKGIRVRFDKSVDEEVKRACKEYIFWLRKWYEFPIRVPIYFKSSKFVTASTGEKLSAIFFGPYDKTVEPYIKIAVGDYEDLLEEVGKDNALCAMLCSITHELSHYFQWIKNFNTDTKCSERQAKYYAKVIVDDYAETREHP